MTWVQIIVNAILTGVFSASAAATFFFFQNRKARFCTESNKTEILIMNIGKGDALNVKLTDGKNSLWIGEIKTGDYFVFRPETEIIKLEYIDYGIIKRKHSKIIKTKIKNTFSFSKRHVIDKYTHELKEFTKE